MPRLTTHSSNRWFNAAVEGDHCVGARICGFSAGTSRGVELSLQWLVLRSEVESLLAASNPVNHSGPEGTTRGHDRMVGRRLG